MRALLAFGIIAVIVAIVGPQVFYTVDQTQYVVITRFGEVREIRLTPGLKTKVPFVDAVNPLDNRLLRVDVAQESFQDAEKQLLEIDAYVRYRIRDPRQFLQTLITELNAESRIADIVKSALRAEIGQRNRNEIIGASATIGPDGLPVITRLASPEGIATREDITRKARLSADESARAQSWGIEIVDLRMKRADFPTATEQNVFARMRTERDVQAQRLRAEGEQEYLKIIAEVDRQVEVISAEADQKSNTARGEGEAEAIRILAEALGKDPELYSFLRSLQAYRVLLTGHTTAVLTADSDLFKFLQSPFAKPTPTPAPSK